MAPFEALYGRKCRTPTCWLEAGEKQFAGPEIIQETADKVKGIRERLKAAQDRQKSYADKKRRPIDFQVGERVMLKVSPWKGIIRFGKRGKLSPRFLGTFTILEKVGQQAYRLELPPEMDGIHPTFHKTGFKPFLTSFGHNSFIPCPILAIFLPTFSIFKALQDLEVKSTLGASSGGNHLSPLHLLHSSFSPPLLLEERKAPNPRVLAWISLGSFSDREVKVLAPPRLIFEKVPTFYQLSAAKMKFSAAKLAFALTRRFQNLPKIEGVGFLSVSRRERLLGERETASGPSFKYCSQPSVPYAFLDRKIHGRYDTWTFLRYIAIDQVFGPVVLTPPSVKPVGHKWVFVRKRNENNEVIRYKARLVAQGFSQRPGIDYEETYSPVMDVITFRYLISLVVSEGLEMQLMDVVTAYLYGDLDSEIYMKVPNGLTLPDSSKPRNAYAIKLKRSLYGLKQSGRMWYTRLSEYLIRKGYKNDELCPCVFIKKTSSGFSIIAVYVDDMNIIGTFDEIRDTASYLKSEFEMKDLGKTRYCLGIELEHRACGILIHQSAYIQKILRRFNMDKAHPASTPMIGRSLDIKKDPFRPKDDDEEVLGAEIPYLSAIGALLYLAQCTRPDIAFSVNLLARFSSAPTQRHWNGFADAGYLSDPHKCRSQTGYVFTIGNTAISWKSTKQTLVATSSNHSEIIALHEAVRECIWLRSVITHIRGASGLSSTTHNPTCIYENNAACIEQMKVGYIKGDNTKHISPKFFYNQQQQTLLKIQVNQVRSEENVADLFTKSLPKVTFKKHVESIGMRRLSKLL
ncbi:hypothetical protein OSB04_032124 [Centaurea solstitialis]|uniref:Reverse transcriptase Ty1/copia-type domain-containing protein n=1 Tax=Centaurea solstitialis TaxID=347529 RepID=A0AA38W8S7_9ASTR|nr:hypothetical protein OSB04_032124 [Centaurea solstitialis]